MEFDEKTMKKGICTLKLNEMAQDENDPLLIRCTYSIIDFSQSGNNQIIPKELGIESAPSLKNKPLLCVYTKNTNDSNTNPNDFFSGHGEFEGQDRYGNDIIDSNSIAIGFAPSGGFLTTIKDENDIDKEVIACEFVLWADRNIPILQLIQAIYDSGEPLYSSCEYWYYNYEVNEGIETLKSPLLFSGQCLLGNGHQPAFESSKLLSLNEKWEKAVNECIKSEVDKKKNNSIDDLNKINNQKEDKSMAEEVKEMFKKVCELSFDDIRSLIYGQLKAVLSDEEYMDSWISDTFDTYFVLSYWNVSDHKYYKVTYTKTNDVVAIDWENRVEVFLYQEWKEIPAVQLALNEKEDVIKTLNSTIETLTTEKTDLSTKFNNATDSITELTKQVNEMKPLVETYNTEQYEKALNEQKDKFEEKFVALNAKEKFDSEEVQELIKKSINEAEDGKEAILSLNSMLVDLVKPLGDKKEVKIIKEVNNKKMENLIDTKVSFEDRYFV